MTDENKLLELMSMSAKNFIESRQIINHNLTNHFSEKNYEYIRKTNDITRNIVEKFVDLIKDSEDKNLQTSCDFNIFKIFGVNETMHSYLLAHFLNPNSSHGQKHLFLNEFLDLLGIERYNDNENWLVTAEKGRIDLLLLRNTPHSVVVIENKSNYAIDQENQLYRYWYQEIYSSINSRNLPSDYILNPPEKFYQLIYLSPNHLKIPNNNSLIKPLNWDSNLPSEVPLKTKQIVFSEFIVNWLELSLSKIPKQNTRIKEHLKQYIEIWIN